MVQPLLPTATLILTFLFLSPPSSTTTATATDNSRVLDVDGNPVETLSPYYIISMISNRGLINIPRNRSSCPILNVALARERNNLGRSHIFIPTHGTEKFVTLSSNLRIFSEPVLPRPPLYCPQLSGWRAVYDRPTATFLVTLGGDKSSSQLFKIKSVKVDAKVAYMIEFTCPSSVDPSLSCGYVGFLPENGENILAMYQLPGLFAFKKAPMYGYY